MLTATHDAPRILCHDGWHNAFTDLAWWHDHLWLGFRRAPTHGITPPGSIQIWRSRGQDTLDLVPQHAITLPGADLRDPRFLWTPEALYCLVGAYHPRPGRQDLSTDSAENLIQTYVTSTVDGEIWTALQPILRPQYWGWSAVQINDGQRTTYYVASYHTGGHGETSSLVLWIGFSLLAMEPLDTIYQGASVDSANGPHFSPSEPVLFVTPGGTLGCCVRSESTMDLGVAIPPYQAAQWRWTDTRHRIHPSRVCLTPHGLLLAGRALTDPVTVQYGKGRQRPLPQTPTVGLWHLDGGRPVKLLTLPSAGDCAYAGLVPGTEKDSYWLSYYTQGLTGTAAASAGHGAMIAFVECQVNVR